MLQLRFLTTDAHQVELARRYWDFDPQAGTFASLTADESAALGGGGLMAAGQLAAACLAYDDAEPCPRCGEPAWFFATREEYLAYHRDCLNRRISQAPSQARLCPGCAAQEENRQEKDADPVTSRFVVAEKAALPDGTQVWTDPRHKSQLRLMAALHLLKQPPQVRLEALSFEQAVFLDACWRAGMAESLHYLRTLSEFESEGIKLAPTFPDGWDLVGELARARLILFDPNSDQKAELNDYSPKYGFSYYTPHARHYFPVSADAPQEPAALFHQIERAFSAGDWPEHWKGQSLALWRRVAQWEVMEYLYSFTDIYALTFTPGEKTRALVNGLLERYSTAQICWLVRCAGRMALTSLTRGGVTREQAAATIPGLVQRLADRAGAAEWKVERLTRTRQCAQSVVSQVLFDAALKVGEAGWTEVAREV